MAIRDLLWACPLCRTPGGIRAARQAARRIERCGTCEATFRRGDGADIVARTAGGEVTRPAAEWARLAGPIRVPEPDAAGVILGPARVRVRRTTGQKPLRFGAELLGWIETFGSTTTGQATLLREGLSFAPDDGAPATLWTLDSITGVQPASAAIQIGLGRQMVSIRFVDAAVRMWTRALTEVLRAHYAARGSDVLQFQPRIRTCVSATPPERRVVTGRQTP